MKKVFTLVTAAFLLSANLCAQNIVVTNALGQSPATFIQSNLLGGGVYIFNAKFNNSSANINTENIGTFNANGYAGLSMADGVLMTTGNISVAVGPNDGSGTSVPITGYYSDPEMAPIATDDINGCSTLDFDFVTLASSVSFNYTFASEEYPEYVCSQFNDVFAFFVTGPDPETGEEVTRNIAIIPGTVDAAHPDGIAVAINSVNPGASGGSGGSGSGCYYDYSNYYVSNSDSSGWANYADGIQYDGYTSKLAASADVLPCVVYHMHISVCNVGDNSFDSGVFLEGGSFSAPTAAIGLSRPGITALHGSCPFPVSLSLASTNFDEGTVVFGFGGTAVEGVDFELTDENGNPFTTGMHIDNDVHNFILRGLPNADLSEEKTIELYLATSLCSSFPQLVTYDTMRFTLDHGGDVRVKDTTISCTHACFEVGTDLIYGEDVSYRWEPTTGLDDPYSLTTTAMIFESTDYQLIATGGSGCNSDTADVHVVITEGNPDIPVAIDEVESADFSVYPNPSEGDVTVSVVEPSVVTVYDVTGRMVVPATPVTQQSPLTLQLPAGVYGVRISNAQGTEGTKIVVNK